MVYALILSFATCVLAMLAFSLVAQPELWLKLWSPHRGLIVAADSTASAYSQTGIRVRLAMLGVIFACAAAFIPMGYVEADMNASSSQALPAAITAAKPKPVTLRATPHPARVVERSGANARPDQPPAAVYLPAPAPAACYDAPQDAANEFDPTLDPWAIRDNASTPREANNIP
jgi:hypothetical protein